MTQAEFYVFCKENMPQYKISKQIVGNAVLIQNGKILVKAYCDKNNNIKLSKEAKFSGWWTFWWVVSIFTLFLIGAIIFNIIKSFNTPSDPEMANFRKEINSIIKTNLEKKLKREIVVHYI